MIKHMLWYGMRLKWFGHVQRMDASRIPRRLYFWNPTHGRRRRGRPRTAWKDTINKDINKMDLGWSVEEAEVAAKDPKCGEVSC